MKTWRMLKSLTWGLLILMACAVLSACSRPYRVGDHVLVEWGEENQVYPAFIIQVKNATRYRVHFEGYAPRWDEDVTLERIIGMVKGPVSAPPPPRHVRLIQGNQKNEGEADQLNHVELGDRIKVKWRGTEYRATVIQVIGPGKMKVHYENYEDAWDEVVDASRIILAP